MKKSTKTTAPKQQHVPQQLMVLMAMLGERDQKEALSALTAARHAIRDFSYSDDADGSGSIFGYVARSGETGLWAKSVARAYALDPGNINGDLINAFGRPAVIAGLAFAWLVLTNDGGAR